MYTDTYSSCVFCTCFHHQNFVVVVSLHEKPNFGSAIDDVPLSNWFKLEPQHGARLATFWAGLKSSRKHCQPGAIDNGTLALLNGTCILFPESRPVFEQKSWEPRSYTGHIQCLLHLLPPSKPRSRSESAWKTKFRLSHSWCTHVKLEPGHGARLAMFSARFFKSSWKHCQPGAIHNGLPHLSAWAMRLQKASWNRCQFQENWITGEPIFWKEINETKQQWNKVSLIHIH